MEHTLNKSLFIILPNLTCFFWEKNRHFIFVHLVYSDKSRTPIHFSVLSRVVSESIKSDILLIKRLGVDKAIIKIKTADAANRLLSNPVFDKKVFEFSFHPLKSSAPELSKALVSPSRWTVSEKI